MTTFNTDMVENFCERCRAEMEWQQWEYSETCVCRFEGNEYSCPQFQREFFDEE